MAKAYGAGSECQGWNHIVQGFTDYGKGSDCSSKSNEKPSLNLKIVWRVDAMEIKNQGSSTGFQVRIICNIESGVIKSFFLLLYIILHDNWDNVEEDPKVLVPSDLGNLREIISLECLNLASLYLVQIGTWSFEIQI